jgi:hypothetical protein
MCSALRSPQTAAVFLESPFRPNHHPSLHLHDAIVPTRLDDLAIDTGWPKDLPDDSFIELKSVRHDQRNIFLVRSFSNVPKQGQRALVAASADHGRRPKSGPDLDGCENRGRLWLTLNDRSDLVGLKFGGPEPVYSLIVEATAAVAGFLQPAIDCIPADARDGAIDDLFKPSTLRVAT